MRVMIRCLQFLRRYGTAYYTSLRTCSTKFVDLPSDLYVFNDYKETVFASLDPHFDVEGTFKDKCKLKSDLEMRNINVDVDMLHKNGIAFIALKELITTLQLELRTLNGQLHKMVKMTDDQSKQEVSLLKSKLSDLLKNAKVAKEQISVFEKSFVIPFLDLPNKLHKNTGSKDEVIFSLFSKPRFTFPAKSHIDIGSLKGELLLEDVSPTAYYLKGRLALLEMALKEFVQTRFREFGFRDYATTDMVKSVVVAGCGMNTKAKNEWQLKIQDKSNFISNQVQFLVGSASLPSLVAMLCHSTVEVASESPLRFLSIGQKYVSPIDASRGLNPAPLKGLFSAIQSPSASALIAYPIDMSEESVVSEVAMMLTQIYTELGLHFILVQYGASKLRVHESLAIGVCMFSPYFKKYIEVSRISLCQDYISKRLQIYQHLGKNRAAFLGLVFVEILDVKNWIGSMVENTQTCNGDYIIPECLEPHLLK